MKTFIIASLSADGYIAKDHKHKSKDWTTKEDRHFFVERTKQARVVIMGANTAKSIGKPLPERLNIVYSHHPEEFPGWKVTKDDPVMVLDDLIERGYEEAAICGGASIYSMFLKANLVDKLYLSIHPTLFGQGIKLYSEELEKQLELVSVDRLGEQVVLLEYNVNK